jgi:hypothetical protein
MREINLALGLMALLLVLLSSQTLGRKVIAQDEGIVLESSLACQDVSGCCGGAACNGPGTSSYCTITCTGGGSVTCSSFTNGVCSGP